MLVSGSTGFIGSHLVESLIDKRYRVSCLIRKETDLSQVKRNGVEIIEGNFLDKKSLAGAVRGMDVVFHVGAVISAPDWNVYYRSNVEATKNLLHACAAANPALKKFVFVSSISAAGPSINGKPLNESDPCHPVSDYGKSKLLAEGACRCFFDRLPIVIIRPTNVLGIGQTDLATILKLAKRRIMPLLGNGDRQTTVCFVQDLVRALIMAAENESIRGKIYFVANPEAYSWREMLEFIARELGQSFVIKVPYPVLLVMAFLSELTGRLTGRSSMLNLGTIRSIRKHYWLQDVTRIRKELGFSPEISFADGMRGILKGYKNKGLR